MIFINTVGYLWQLLPFWFQVLTLSSFIVVMAATIVSSFTYDDSTLFILETWIEWPFKQLEDALGLGSFSWMTTFPVMAFMWIVFWWLSIPLTIWEYLIKPLGGQLKKYREYRKFRKPLICLYRLNGKVGITLRSDYNKSSRLYWRKAGRHWDFLAFQCNKHVTGIKLAVKPVFVFPVNSPEHNLLTCACFVEEAVFELPSLTVFEKMDNIHFEQACRRIFGARRYKDYVRELQNVPEIHSRIAM